MAKVRQLAGTDRNGTTLAGLVRGGEALGFETKALKGHPDSLRRLGRTPVIAHLRLVREEGASDHFVVVVPQGRGRIKVFDPLFGVLKLTIEAFSPLWTGFIVVLTPRPDYGPTRTTKGPLLRFLPALRPYVTTLALVGLGALVLVVLGVVGSFYLRYLVDDILPARAWTSLHVVSAGILGLTLFQGLLEASRKAMLLHLSLRVDNGLLFSFFDHVLRLPLSFFDARMNGDTLSRMDQLGEIRSGLADAVLVLAMDSLLVLIVGAVLVLQSGVLFLVSIVSVPLVALVIGIFARFFSANYQKLMAEGAEVQSTLVEALNGLGTIKALNAEARVREVFVDKQTKVAGSNLRLGMLEIRQGLLLGLIHGWSTNLIYWVGSSLILGNQLSLGQLLSFGALVGFFLGPLQRLVNLQADLQRALAAARRVGEIFDLDPEKVPAFRGEARLAGPLKFSEVTFRYGSRRPILTGLDLEVPRGSQVAFVGPSGSGKSTLVKLLLKFYRPEAGKITVDGVDLEDLDAGQVRRGVGYVPQDVVLFSGSIYDNLCLGHPGASLESVSLAARRARAADFIEALPDRYGTVLAEKGASLSGGERQRLALARALVGDPKLLIFDEATSNLDQVSEAAILTTLRSLRSSDTTVILVAHRLASIVDSDLICVFDRGRVVERGAHQDLLAAGGLYARMWREGRS